MSRMIVIVGAGMGGLAAALYLARAGFRVRVVEARAEAGGLASGFTQAGFRFDAGPYVLLDRSGLEWAFRALGLDLADHIALRRIEDVYQVAFPDAALVRFYADLAETAAGFERMWPGSGRRYERFVRSTQRIYERLEDMRYVARPGLAPMLASGAWRDAPFLLRSLGGVLARAGLPDRLIAAIGIWTQIAGQSLAEAPSPLAFVPALIHHVGAFYPEGGIAAIPQALAAAASAAGVEFQFEARVRAIPCAAGRVTGVELADGAFIAADAVVANAGGVGVYVDLVEQLAPSIRKWLERLPLQSPGVCAYLALRGDIRPPYLCFMLPARGERCRLLALPGVLAPEDQRDGWRPARLIAPMDYAQSQRDGVAGQRAYLEQILAERWWRDLVADVRVLGTRIPAEWGSEYHLYRESMNPVMTARFMRMGRLEHRSPYIGGLYLAGSSTHPGQWVSFCAISGVLAARQLCEDLR